MAEINQSNVYMLLHWKVAGFAQLWAKDLGVSTLEAMMRFYDTPFHAKLEDESTKLWTYSPQQLYYLFRNEVKLREAMEQLQHSHQRNCGRARCARLAAAVTCGVAIAFAPHSPKTLSETPSTAS